VSYPLGPHEVTGDTSMHALRSQLDTSAPTSVANDAAQRSLVTELRDIVGRTALGGPEKSRDRHVARGKLLVRDRIDRLLDEGSPFLEVAPLAAHDVYNNDSPA